MAPASGLGRQEGFQSLLQQSRKALEPGLVERRGVGQRVEGEAAGGAVVGLEFDVEVGFEAVFARPEGFQALALFLGLVDAEPEEGFAAEGDDVAAVPAFDQQTAHQRVEAFLDLHGPGFVAHRFVGDGVDPEKVPAELAGSVEVGHVLAVQVAVEDFADDLPAAADEGLAVADFVAAGVAAEEAEGRVGVAEADDGVERVLAEAGVGGGVDAFGFRGQGAEGLALVWVEGHGVPPWLVRVGVVSRSHPPPPRALPPASMQSSPINGRGS